MLAEQEACTIREAVGAFRSTQDFQGAIDDLLNSGFDRAKLSLLASDAAKEKPRQTYYNISVLAGDPTVRRTVYHSTEAIGLLEGGLIGALYSAAVAATGAVVLGSTLATAIATTAIGAAAGGLIGAILAKWVDVHRAHRLQEQVDRGGLLLSVRTCDAEAEKRAIKILGTHSADDVQVHALSAADYRAQTGSAADGMPGPGHWRHGEATAAAYAEKPSRFSKVEIRQQDNARWDLMS